MRIHPITGLMLEDGFGALSDDLQARRIHIPYIRQWHGDAAADSMLTELDTADEPPVPSPIAMPPAKDAADDTAGK